MMIKRFLTIAALIGAIISLSIPAQAGSFLYASSRRQLNVGVLTVGGASENPMVFFVMDQRFDLKPRGWEFVNPLAAGSTGIWKNSAAYWVVDLDRTVISNLVKFDVLYLCMPGAVNLSSRPEAVQKLRTFVDAGGVLWVDQPTSGNATDFGQAFFIKGLRFFKGSEAAPPAMIVSRHHPLLSAPYWLSEPEINSLGAAMLNGAYLQIGNIETGSRRPLESTILMPVVKNVLTDNDKKFAYIGAVHYGSGAIVATAGGVGQTIAQGAILTGAAPNLYVDTGSAAYRTRLLWASQPNLKFAYNLVNWCASWMEFRKDARRSASSVEDLGGGMIERWKLPNAPNASVENGAVFYKNMFFYTDGTGMIYALDASPNEDLDGDSNPDDGQPDGGAPFDIVWRDQAPGGTCSSPIVAEVRLPNGPHFEVVAVQGSDCKVHVWMAFPSTNGILDRVPAYLGELPSPFYGSGGGGGGAPHPLAFHDGWFYQAGVDGIFHAYCPADPTQNWTCPNADPMPNPYGPFKSAPVIGSVVNDDNGAIVDTAYFAGNPGGGVGNVNDRVFAVPIAVRNERLRKGGRPSVSPVCSSYETMFGPMNRKIADGPSVYPDVWATSSTGALMNILPFDPNDSIDDGPNRPGDGAFQISKNGTVPPDPEWIMYANYHLAYPAPGALGPSPVFYRLTPQYTGTLPGGYPGPLSINGVPALSRAGIVHVCAKREGSATTDTGEIQSIQLSFRSGSANPSWDLRWRYLLHGGMIGGLPTGMPPCPGVVMDHTRDNAADQPGTALMRLQPSYSPAMAGDKMFVTCNCGEGGNVNGNWSDAALLCFKADPDLVIRIHEPLIDRTTKRKRDVRLWQPDPLFSMPSVLSPVNEAARVPSQYIDHQRGIIAIRDFATVQTTAGGYMRSPLTPSLPVTAYVDGVQLPQAQVDLSGWNNLLWYFVPYHGNYQKCTGIHAPPTVIGDQVYFQCDDGFMFAVDVETGVTNGGQVYCLPPMYDSANKDRTKHMKWTYAINGTGGTAGGGPFSIAAANGLMGVTAADGLHGFDNPSTLVADNKRLVELDGLGNVTWTLESIMKFGAVAGGSQAIESQTINRPAMARIMNTGDYLVADTGNNQILHLDRSGNVTWWLTTFTDPLNLLRPGDPLQLNQPTDVYAWAGVENLGGVTYSVLHHLVADGGNHRIVDIIDKYDPQGRLVGAQQLNWVSRALETGKRYEFRNVQLWADPADMSKQYVLAGIPNYSLFEAPFETQQAGGSVALLNYRTIDPSSLSVTMGDGSFVSGGVYTKILNVDGLGIDAPLAGLRFVHRFYTGVVGDPWHDIVCTANGVYELKSGGAWYCTWLNDSEYKTLVRPVKPLMGSPPEGPVNVTLTATSAKKVGATRMLISNGYSGPTVANAIFMRSEFCGEVLEIERLPNGPPVLMWYAPRMEVVGGGGPWRLQQYTENGGNLEQPSCVDRAQ